MRLFIGILILTSLAMAANKCPDFSGTYTFHGEDGSADITIAQSGCERITIARKNNYLGTITNEKHILRLDGKLHDGVSWYGGADKMKTAARLMSGNLELVVTSAASGKLFWKELYEMLPNMNLLIKHFDDRTQSYDSGMLAERQK